MLYLHHGIIFIYTKDLIRSDCLLPYIMIFGHRLYLYGVAILTGVLLANVLSVWVLKKYNESIDAFLTLESFVLVGITIGSWLIVKGNHSSLGAAAGGLVFFFSGIFIIKKDPRLYLERLVFVFPLVLSFSRIGCFLAGCCYGIPYSGKFAIVFPQGSLAPAGIPLFPVQPLESVLLMILAAFLFFRYSCAAVPRIVLAETMAFYAVLRFFIDFLRSHDYNMIHGYRLSLSQILCVIILIVSIIIKVLPEGVYNKEGFHD